MAERPRVVIDTNVLISRLLLNDSLPAKAVDLAIEIADILVSDACLEELADVLSRSRFDRYVSVEDRQEFLRRFMQLSQPVTVHTDLQVSRDPRDDKLIALAVDGCANGIISGDDDLLSLHPYRDTAILSPAKFLSAYG